MNEVVVADRASGWHSLKSLVLDSVSSPITRRVYNLGLEEFIAWFGQAPRPSGFTKAAVTLKAFGPSRAESAGLHITPPIVTILQPS